MSFKLSQRSLDKLEGVHPDMVKCVKSAIEYTKVDFGVICGMRSESEQKELVAKGASKTMRSKHLTGHAVDLMAYVGSRASWELNLYDDIADGKFGEAAKTGKWYLACKAAKDANPKPNIDQLKNEIDALIATEESS